MLREEDSMWTIANNTFENIAGRDIVTDGPS